MTTAKSLDYTKLTDELAEIVARMEQGDLDVDEAVACYERGLKIINQLESHLKHAENRVAELRAELDVQEEE